MPEENREGIAQPWTYFEDKPRYGQLLAFLSVIVGTSRSWSDELQLLMPGYRDRVVHVSVGDDEGGLNLNMAEPSIRRLSARGVFAGKELVHRFADLETEHPLSWPITVGCVSARR